MPAIKIDTVFIALSMLWSNPECLVIVSLPLYPMNTRPFRHHLETFIRLNDEEFASVIKYFTFRKIEKNQHLLLAGDYATSTWWVNRGLLISTFTDTEGKEHIIQFAVENCWITDQESFYKGTKSTLNILSLENSEVFCLSYENREKLCAAMHSMEQFFRKKANDSFVKQQKRLLTYMTSDAQERFDLLMKEYPGIAQRLSKKILAAYLGVTRETLSRLR